MPRTHGGSIGHHIHAHDMTRLTCAPPAPTDGGSTGSTGSAVGPGVETITVSFFGHSLSRSVFAWLGLGRGRARKKKVQRSESRMQSSGGARREAIAGERVSLRVSRLAEHVSAAFPLPLHVPHVLRRAITLKCVPARSDFKKLRTQHLKHVNHVYVAYWSKYKVMEVMGGSEGFSAEAEKMHMQVLKMTDGKSADLKHCKISEF